MSEFNQRQYRLMLDCLLAFEAGKLPIDVLISNLQGLVRALQGVDEAWKQTFLEDWAVLEQARAMALFRESTSLNERETSAASDSVARLKLLVLEQMDDPPEVRFGRSGI
jgi:hypothetical protein